MHSGTLDARTLRLLEAAIWGDTHTSGAITIALENDSAPTSSRYSKTRRASFTDKQKTSEYGIAHSNPKKVTQGLWYATYGMDEGRGDARRHLDPPASWKLRITARSSRFFVNRSDATDPQKSGSGRPIAAADVMNQAKAALWLLCHLGGVGSKARKGFGSLAASDLGEWTVDRCSQLADQFRRKLQLSADKSNAGCDSSSLRHLLPVFEVEFAWPSIWSVLDQVGFAYQAYAVRFKHQREKFALGLPRRLRDPISGNFKPKLPVTTNGGRHASPVHIHIDKLERGWTVRVSAFPAARLPDLETSREFLRGFMAFFEQDLRRRSALKPLGGSQMSTVGAGVQRERPAGAPAAGDRVEAELLVEKTKKGGWLAKLLTHDLKGPINNHGDVPSDKKAGDRLTLIIASINEKAVAFRYPTAADEQKGKGGKGAPPKRPGGPPQRGWR